MPFNIQMFLFSLCAKTLLSQASGKHLVRMNVCYLVEVQTLAGLMPLQILQL